MLTDRSLDRLRKNFYDLWKALQELRFAPDPQELLTQWLMAKKPSQEWRKGRHLEQAISILAVATDTERDVMEEDVYEYVGLYAEADEAAI
ncbi:MAG: hypothetical protein H0T55_00790 [Rubrobacteraceae bacterium]|nr:hypothetical protein [Rubrobacteraceae bacterium]